MKHFFPKKTNVAEEECMQAFVKQLKCTGTVLMRRGEMQELDCRFVSWRKQRRDLLFQKISAALSRRLKPQQESLCGCLAASSWNLFFIMFYLGWIKSSQGWKNGITMRDSWQRKCLSLLPKASISPCWSCSCLCFPQSRMHKFRHISMVSYKYLNAFSFFTVIFKAILP